MTPSPELPTPMASLMSSTKLNKKSLPIKPALRRYSLTSGTAMSLLKCPRYTATTKSQVTTRTTSISPW